MMMIEMMIMMSMMRDVVSVDVLGGYGVSMTVDPRKGVGHCDHSDQESEFGDHFRFDSWTVALEEASSRM
jgi:hypothetical protein